MNLMTCAACNGQVSDTAMTCVHCGNVLQKQRPGAVGMIIRLLYAIFTVGVIVIGIAAMQQAKGDPEAAAMVPLIMGGIWVVVSIALSILMYVTRGGRQVRVTGAIK